MKLWCILRAICRFSVFNVFGGATFFPNYFGHDYLVFKPCWVPLLVLKLLSAPHFRFQITWGNIFWLWNHTEHILWPLQLWNTLQLQKCYWVPVATLYVGAYKRYR